MITLDATCEALHLALTERQRTGLLRYLAMLQRWNATYNLTAVRNAEDMLVQHLADCLAVIGPLRRQNAGGRLLDVGSGGGLPGVVIGLMLPELNVTCVDAVGKKAAFVRQVVGAVQTPNVTALHARVETLDAVPFDLIVSRAFASLPDFTALTARSLAPGGVWMAMKGRRPEEEIAALPTSVEMFHVEQLQVPGMDAQRCLVWMRPAAVPQQN